MRRMLFVPQRPPVIFDLDDFCEEIMTSELWELVLELKKKCPAFKVTMFTIPDRCSEGWLKDVRQKYDWIEMHYHGSKHVDRDEWLGKSKIEMPYSDRGIFYRGFKAPWWRMDQRTADLFDSQGYVLSCRSRGRFDVRAKKVYRFDTGLEVIPNVAYQGEGLHIHSHVQSQKQADGMPDIFEQIASLLRPSDQFLFISELF
jgi:hypothetical protein